MGENQGLQGKKHLQLSLRGEEAWGEGPPHTAQTAGQPLLLGMRSKSTQDPYPCLQSLSHPFSTQDPVVHAAAGQEDPASTRRLLG